MTTTKSTAVTARASSLSLETTLSLGATDKGTGRASALSCDSNRDMSWHGNMTGPETNGGTGSKRVFNHRRCSSPKPGNSRLRGDVGGAKT
eukprot:5164841-Prymnesium_polylepis.1